MVRFIRVLISVSLILLFIRCSEENNNFPNNVPPNYPNYVYPKVDIKAQYKIFNKGCDYSVAWHPSGDRIIFLYNPDWRRHCIASINPDGGDLKILYEGNSVGYFNSISNDVYLVLGNGLMIYYFNLNTNEDSVETDLKGTWPTVYGNLSGIYNIAYYHDDDRYIIGSSIYISDINGSLPIKLLDEVNGIVYVALSWTFDGKLLISETDIESSICRLFTYDINTKEERDLYYIRDLEVSDSIYEAKFSPDGRYIAFSASPYPFINSHGKVIWLMTSDCKKVWIITDDINSDVKELSWSPDGRWIVYDVYNSNSQEYELWKVRVFE